MRRNGRLEKVKEFLFPESVPNRAVPTMDGGLTPNSALDGFAVVASPHEPEDLALAGPGVLMVTAGDRLLRVDLASGEATIVASFTGKAMGLAVTPTGCLVCVSGQGLLWVGATGTTETVVAPDAFPGAGHLTSVATRGEEVYVTSASESHSPEAWAHDLFSGGRTGRLVKIAPDGRTETLAEGLQWPYGLCLTDDELVVSESWAHRLVGFSIGGGQQRVIRDRLPAYPARLTSSPTGTFWVAMFAPRSYLVEFVMREDAYRDAMVRTMVEDDWVRPSIRTTNAVREPLQLGRARHLGEVKPWAPTRSYGLVAEMTPKGDFLRSYHSRADGARHGTTAALQVEGQLVVTSAGASLLVRTPLDGKADA
jgi:hypothetical protein